MAVLLPVLFSSGYVLPWESSGEGWNYPSSFAPPLQVAIEASDGASDYGNKFGEPVLSGRRLYWSEAKSYISPFIVVLSSPFHIFLFAFRQRSHVV